MKVLPFKIPKPELAAFIYQVDKEPSFYNKLHQHEEIQLSYILKGEGTLSVGDSINYYKPGDVLVIGSQVPHVFQSDQEQHQQSHMVSLFFTDTRFGKTLFELEELMELQGVSIRSKQGIHVNSKH